MSGYLERYGEGEEKREHVLRNSIVIGVAAIVLAALAFYLLRTHHQVRITNRFLSLLRAKDYAGAYAAWGCDSAHPCREYPYAKFLEDWGPQSASGRDPVLRLTDSESCGAGVILSVNASQGNEQKLYISKDNDALSFSPMPTCPHKSAWAIMAHRTLGRMRTVFY